MFKLEGKKALITGASGGIGATIAKTLHQQGAIVALSGTRREALEKIAQDLKERVHVLPCNLKSIEDIESLIPQAESAMEQVDILVNNAGITRDNLMMRMKDDEFSEVIDINLGATFRLMRAAIKGMMKRREGRIINITSIVGVTGNPGQANYCASKAGVIGMSKSLAQEIASRGVTVNCVAPGFIQTPMTDVLPEGHKEKLLTTIPQGRMGLPEEIAAGVAFLASAEAAYITGQTLHINGGMAMI
ncbi:MAG: 3-oxoacyl-[acyl-carrier-protein] reductase [Candidatus Paracaedimonas acanthamoebae]|uniref:3-oxoacyl-[acyl-carrier-protein] reductase n=1 Tax=Candidatus Paracaedimonas acanthamoebae TaxID=244581 RepID=A0A8J7PWG8_9PROT|nr:3-oxoacyl-[acyl-carrier-protein] reductase [Candidatus Paracaedimonas acanthamoebae]